MKTIFSLSVVALLVSAFPQAADFQPVTCEGMYSRQRFRQNPADKLSDHGPGSQDESGSKRFPRGVRRTCPWPLLPMTAAHCFACLAAC